MSSPHPACREIEPDLLAVASGEAAPAAAERVERHVVGCGPCREELRHYRAIEGFVGELRRAPLPGDDAVLARAELESRLADLRRRLVSFGVFSSPLGPILIARSELGVSLVRYLAGRGPVASEVRRHLGRSPQAEIRAVQLKRVKQLLGESDLPLDRIASLAGYSHPEYMSVVFKRETAQTPGQYRATASSLIKARVKKARVATVGVGAEM